MLDNPISKYVRAKKGLPDNWRVYLTEAVSDLKKGSPDRIACQTC